MLKKVMLLVLMFVGILNAANLNLNKNNYNPNEQIRVHFSEMAGKNQDWIAIYPENSNNQWVNVKRWNWTDDKAAGDLVFQGLPVGNYEVRAFYNNSYHVEVSKKFRVGAANAEATVTTNKASYAQGETVTASFNHMSGNNQDWIAVYPAGADNKWANVVDWAYTNGKVQGTQSFKNLPKGNYEVRVFFRNTYHVEARHAFKVGGVNGGAATVTTNKASYTQGETVTASFNHMSGNNKDWIAVYPAGADNKWANVVDWAYTNGKVQGTQSFKNLPKGNYDVRVFFNNTYVLRAHHAFSVVAVHHEPRRVVYDDFEDGIDPRWSKNNIGKPMILLDSGVKNEVIPSKNRKVKINGQHSLRLIYAVNAKKENAAYYFNFQKPAQEFKFLELDVSALHAPHYISFGVYVNTKDGEKVILFKAVLNHQLKNREQHVLRPYGNILQGHREAELYMNGYMHLHPGPSDFYVGSTGKGKNKFVHFKINIEEKLKLLEPNNELLGITYFIATGGNYDNLALTNY